jgi:hypothetical protein
MQPTQSELNRKRVRETATVFLRMKREMDMLKKALRDTVKENLRLQSIIRRTSR